MKKFLLLILLTCFVAFAQAQPFGSALWFDDLNDYVSANSVSTAMSSQEAMTLEAWIYPESFETQDFVLTFHAAVPDYDNRILLGLKSGKLVAGYKTPSSVDISSYGTNTLPLNQWSHIAWTIAADGLSVVYLNGVIEINTFTVDVGAWPESGGTFSIGQDYDGAVTTDHFHGLIDEVRVWNVVRTQTEIQNNRSDVLSNPTGETNLVAYFTFDDTSNGTLTDESANSNTGILHFYDGGDGTPEDAYQIASVTDLVYLSQHSSDWNKNFLQTANIDFGSDETAVDWDGDGTADLDSADQLGFSPIGNTTDPRFTGSYDGANHTISNLFINRPSQDYIALFGATSNATIANVGLLNVDFTGDYQVGSLVGFCGRWSASTVNNCYSTGNITGTNGTGGLVAYTQNGTQINNCYTTVNVNGGSAVGGLVGYHMGTSSITNCYSAGAVSGTSSTGGFIGYNGAIHNDNSTVVTNSYWDKETSGQTASEGGTGLTTAQMKSASNFTNWDFTAETGDWQIENDYYISYPYLQAFTYDAPGTSPGVNPIPGLATAPATWTGATDSDWNTASNWNPAVVPASDRDATIPASGISNYPVVSSSTNAAVKNLTNNSTTNSAITVQAGGRLTINGTYTTVNGAEIKVTGAQ